MLAARRIPVGNASGVRPGGLRNSVRVFCSSPPAPKEAPAAAAKQAPKRPSTKANAPALAKGPAAPPASAKASAPTKPTIARPSRVRLTALHACRCLYKGERLRAFEFTHHALHALARHLQSPDNWSKMVDAEKTGATIEVVVQGQNAGGLVVKFTEVPDARGGERVECVQGLLTATLKVAALRGTIALFPDDSLPHDLNMNLALGWQCSCSWGHPVLLPTQLTCVLRM